MKCLTVCQPWASAIIYGSKRIENRGRPITYRGPLLIHAGKSAKRFEAEDPRTWPERYGMPLPAESDLALGHILGLVDVVDCRCLADLASGLDDDPFAEGPWCWILARPRAFATPIPWRGQLSTYNVPDDVVKKALRTLRPLAAV